MSIDWITVIAQIANFLVLVWLLKRFLYQPILNGIDAREAEIAERMGEAEKARRKAVAAEADFVARKNKLLVEDAAIVDAAIKEAERQRDALLAETHQKLEQEHKDWQRHLQREQQKFTAELYRAGADTLYQLVRKALRDLADDQLEERIALHVTAKLEPMAPDLLAAAGRAEEAIASTHVSLSEGAQATLVRALADLMPGIPIRFQVDDDQAPGLVLRIGSTQVAWTVDSYTEELVVLLTDRLATGALGRGASDDG
ncbi:F0F1 ATP synthase subunit B family protein [Marinobacter sp. F4206]|uniref:F0F1 ATP synthase subunit B family protein n=1 Tax=Marinobacter sp. F4206 TaxID=2861777 RepID=UPI001C5F89F1|nr:F0F1 ATP synthase subunit B [Marinobacter sp. F4206]MBW4935321.1 F0F1 ATP synthase subunit B [Marinobacter sp. F4206]